MRAGHKPRLFWVTVAAFVLAIVLGVCGMVAFAGLAFMTAAPSAPTMPREMLHDAPPAYAAVLADYYVANGDSWEGVERRLSTAPFAGPLSFTDYALLDAEGRAVASNAQGVMPGEPLELRGGVPVVARGERVGTLVLLRSSGPPSPGREVPPFLRSFAAAGLGLTLILALLAVLFAGWLNRPLRHLTAAAGALAAGRLDVQVPPAGIRELDELARAFNRMARAIADGDRQRRQLTADVAHELRTPLTIIKGRLEGIQDGVYAATPDQVERLLAETALLERLIEDLRVLALADAGQLTLYREPTDPAALLQGAAAAFAAQAAAQGVALRVVAPDDLPQLEVDPQRMAQVLANLVSNALRHTSSGGSITLKAEFIADRRLQIADWSLSKQQSAIYNLQSAIVMQVVDTGAGIAAEDLPHIFDRFWRADRARTRGGAGLGLAITRQLVEAHGGQVRAASEAGRGTTITMVLPAAGQPAELSPASDRSPPSGA
jgi:two-component system OmpR family sensor kinase/two-component system sensor histidine kinase BaeS